MLRTTNEKEHGIWLSENNKIFNKIIYIFDIFMKTVKFHILCLKHPLYIYTIFLSIPLLLNI